MDSTGRTYWQRPKQPQCCACSLSRLGRKDLSCFSMTKTPCASTMGRPVPACRCCSSPAEIEFDGLRLDQRQPTHQGQAGTFRFLIYGR